MHMRELEKTFIEEYIGAEEQLEKERYKNATILFSKALFAICDMLIFEKISKLPNNHRERFIILQEYLPEAYAIVDSVFKDYTDAYSKSLNKANCEQIKNGIKKINRTNNVPEEIKKIIEQ